MDPGLAMEPDAQAQRTLDERLAGEIPRLRGFFARLLGRPSSELDDLVQESLARALHYRASFDARRALWPWLKRTAFRVFLDHRERTRRVVPSAGDGAVEECVALVDDTGERRDELDVLLAALPGLQRDVLLRFHCDGHSVRRIAQALRMPEGTIKSHLHRARRTLASRGHPDGAR